jgi:hypothetical protein
MSTFTIPSDPDKADHLATELGELATAAEWKRAALVYARVRVQDSAGGDPATRAKVKGDIGDQRLTPAEYALRGIHGLRSKTTIRAYYRAWDNAVVEGLAQPVELGDEVELPDSAQWEDCYTPQNRSVSPFERPEPQSETDRQRSQGAANRLGRGQCPPLASSLDVDDDEVDFPAQQKPTLGKALNRSKPMERRRDAWREASEQQFDPKPHKPQPHKGTLNVWLIQWTVIADYICEEFETLDDSVTPEQAEEVLAVAAKFLTQFNRLRKQLSERVGETP